MSCKHQKNIQTSCKCDYQKQFKYILEADMIYALEGFTDNIPISPMTSIPVKKPSARKITVYFY